MIINSHSTGWAPHTHSTVYKYNVSTELGGRQRGCPACKIKLTFRFIVSAQDCMVTYKILGIIILSTARSANLQL